MSTKMTTAEITTAGRKIREAWERHRAAMDGAKVPLPDSEAGTFHFTNEAMTEAEVIGPIFSFRLAA